MKGESKAFNIRIPKWIDDEMIGPAKNKTTRIQELIVKGYLFEQREERLINARKSSEAVHNSPEVWRRHPLFLGENPATEPCPVAST